MSIDWRRGLGYKNDDYCPPIEMLEKRYKELQVEADNYDDMRRYGMHVGLDALFAAAKKELGYSGL